MTYLKSTPRTESLPLAEQLLAADLKFIRAERALVGALVCGEDDDVVGAAVDSASDERWDLEETALASGDAEAVAIVQRRRERDPA